MYVVTLSSSQATKKQKQCVIDDGVVGWQRERERTKAKSWVGSGVPPFIERIRDKRQGKVHTAFFYINKQVSPSPLLLVKLRTRGEITRQILSKTKELRMR